MIKALAFKLTNLSPLTLDTLTICHPWQIRVIKRRKAQTRESGANQLLTKITFKIGEPSKPSADSPGREFLFTPPYRTCSQANISSFCSYRVTITSRSTLIARILKFQRSRRPIGTARYRVQIISSQFIVWLDVGLFSLPSQEICFHTFVWFAT